MGAAAAIAVLLGGALIYRTLQQPATPIVTAAAITYSTGVAQLDSLHLPDGTLVVLAPGSELTVQAGYGADARTVALTGEALFDVIHEDARPFTVQAGDATIVDLGTTFTVRNPRDADAVRVVVTAGVVVLRAAAAADSVVLNAGDRGVLVDGKPVAERAAVSADDVAWTTGRLVFRDASIADVSCLVDIRQTFVNGPEACDVW
jgi:transmembrane sensor